jgi:hypothetical protein
MIGKRPVNEIDVRTIQSVLNRIWPTKEETARRMRQRIAAVLSYAYSKDWRSEDAPNPRTVAED